MRKAHSALLALSLALMVVPEIAAAGGTFAVVPGFRGIGYPGSYGYARLYGHPFDDGYRQGLAAKSSQDLRLIAGCDPAR
jgi:hypothetical protein